MRNVHNQPTTGQFVATWEFDDELWSGVFNFNEDGVLCRYYDGEVDDFIEEGHYSFFIPGMDNIEYFVMGE